MKTDPNVASSLESFLYVILLSNFLCLNSIRFSVSNKLTHFHGVFIKYLFLHNSVELCQLAYNFPSLFWMSAVCFSGFNNKLELLLIGPLSQSCTKKLFIVLFFLRKNPCINEMVVSSIKVLYEKRHELMM